MNNDDTEKKDEVNDNAAHSRDEEKDLKPKKRINSEDLFSSNVNKEKDGYDVFPPISKK